MAEESRCQYCWNPEGGHNNNCPEALGTPAAMTEWNVGYDYGWNDNYIRPYNWRYYTNTYIYGYRAGKAEVDRLVDEAVRARIRECGY